ncbi:predicted protein [Nematostella vectensis]|uniref:DUF4476 domain-containing protein n=1 Tax=Nematostella vectensis TaxID=45351 RepID=A7SQC8_NEMVE|nr:proline and serine-rich protein 1 [Nematostella vectensis]EDO34109.1 predicted protein [Nematostella vectensis]|eukprot:XP_001626209.1 predicted protein [Nematostella vectensis]
MDPTAFAIVKNEVHRLPHVDDKIQAIVYAQGNLYAEQISELLSTMSFDDDKLKTLQNCVSKMLPASCMGVFPILRWFRSDRSRVQAVQVLAGYITDPMNFNSFNELFPYAPDREMIRRVMTNRTGPPPMAPQYGPETVGNPYPYGRPKPRLDPNDPAYQLVDKTVDAVASGISSFLAPRRSQGAVVVNTPGTVVYQTTTSTSYPGGMTVVNPGGATVVSGPGIRVVTTGAPQYHPYPQQQYYQLPPGAMPPPYKR